MSSVWIFVTALTLTLLQGTGAQYDVANCPPVDSTFELVTGWMYSSPNDILETKTGTLQLAECLNSCRQNVTCQAINFETGLCVLFRSQAMDRAEALIKSQFPVFTMYAQKLCLPSARSCDRAWAFELIRGYGFKVPSERKEMEMPSRMACLDACIQEREFHCRSASWDSTTHACVMADMDRYSQSRIPFVPMPNRDYMESECVPEPNKMCEFKRIENRLLKTVDSLVEGVTTLEECRQMCLNAPYRCHTYDFEGVCRLSHHSSATVTQIEEPYLIMNASSSYERETCYNVTLDCGANQLIATISTNKIFSGKIYARNKPNSCAVDVKNSLDFEIAMDYADAGCGVKQEEPGRFTTDLVLQHHDLVMTAADLGFALRCSFHLENKSVVHGIELQVNGQIQSMGSESSVVPSPNVTMRITDRVGGDIASAQVGDPLALRFEITDKTSPYEIFVRELIAMDGVDGGEIVLIDSRGCPTDASIMGTVTTVPGLKGKALQAPFEAFKFPTSEIVQFQALITPCLPHCAPVNCSVLADPSTGGEFETVSYGRRRRRRRSSPSQETGEQLLVINQLKISDPFDKTTANGGDDEEERTYEDLPHLPVNGSCLNVNTLFFIGSIFIAIQVAMAIGWFCLYKRRSRSSLHKKEFENYIAPHQLLSAAHHGAHTGHSGNGSYPSKFGIPVLPRL